MKRSQYIDKYLCVNSARGISKGYTIQTFLKYTLKGKAARYTPAYITALERSCLEYVRLGKAIKGISKNGGIAYYGQ